MPSDLENFGEIAKTLSRNPLGIIALFIVLIYGINALVLGLFLQNLSQCERLCFICFLTTFPCLVLFIFTWLVIKHHGKLYGFKDYDDEVHFLYTIDNNIHSKKIHGEADEIEFSEKPIQIDNNLRRIPSLASRKELINRIAYVEEWAIKEISVNYGADIQQNVLIGPNSNRKILIDGMFLKNGKKFLIEVKYIRSYKNIRNILHSIHQIQHYISNTKLNASNFILVVVIDDTETKNIPELQKSIQKSIHNSNIGIDLQFFSYSQLKEKYGE